MRYSIIGQYGLCRLGTCSTVYGVVFRLLQLVGYDSGFFAHCSDSAKLSGGGARPAFSSRDVRELSGDLLDDVDAVVHLAAVSNDPMGNKFEQVTEDIYYVVSARLAELARDRGVKNFSLRRAAACTALRERLHEPRVMKFTR